MKIEIRTGFVIHKDDTDTNNELKRLLNLKLIFAEDDIIFTCKRCRNKHFRSQQQSELDTTYCSCGSLIPNPIKEGEHIKIIKEINYKKMLELIQERLKKYSIEYKYDSERNIFITSGDTPIFIIIVGFSRILDILHANGGSNCIFVNLNNSPREFLEPWKGQTIDILQIPEINISDLIKTIPFKTHLVSQDNENKLNKILDKGHTFFEKEFTSFFIKQLQEKDDKLKTFISKLASYKSLLNTKYLPWGASGKSDFYLLPLSHYFSDAFKEGKNGEVKAYRKTEFSFGDFSKAQTHAIGNDVLYLVSTNDIQQEVWTNIVEGKAKNGYFKYVVLDRELILMLVNALEIDLNILLK